MTDAKIDDAVRRVAKEEADLTQAQLRRLALTLAFQSTKGGPQEIVTAAEMFFLFLTREAAAKPTLH